VCEPPQETVHEEEFLTPTENQSAGKLDCKLLQAEPLPEHNTTFLLPVEVKELVVAYAEEV
jgi:hypothetical protein